VLAEGLPGGFSALYPILNHLEESGKVRRGYFVDGLGGAQFALPGAVDRIRSPAPDHAVVALAATDPANPYGAALDWPAVEEGRIGRFAGAYVVLVGGAAAAFADGKRIRVLDPDPDLAAPIAQAIARVASRHRRFSVESIDGGPVGRTPLGLALADAGFGPAPRGLRFHARR
jgi:ATP-dependent helicase Lhr and Lhr-like helicase